MIRTVWSNGTYRAPSQLVGLAVIGLVVGGLAVAAHGHNIGENDARSVVLVGVEEDAQAVKLVLIAKDVALLAPVLGDPHGEPIAKEVALAVDAEFDFNLPVRGSQGYS